MKNRRRNLYILPSRRLVLLASFVFKLTACWCDKVPHPWEEEARGRANERGRGCRNVSPRISRLSLTARQKPLEFSLVWWLASRQLFRGNASPSVCMQILSLIRSEYLLRFSNNGLCRVPQKDYDKCDFGGNKLGSFMMVIGAIPAWAFLNRKLFLKISTVVYRLKNLTWNF